MSVPIETDLLEFAARVSSEAATLTLNWFQKKDLQVELKKDQTEVTDADKAVADAQEALNSAKTVYADAQKAVTSAEADLTTKKKLYSDAVAARKPHEEALATAKNSADTETKNVSDSEVDLESIEAELTSLQVS